MHYMLKVLLDNAGLSATDVEVIPVGLADGVPALANGGIDALATLEPFLSEIERQQLGKRVLGAVDIVPDIPGGLLLVSPEFPRRSPEAADRFVLGWLRGVRHYLDAITKDRDRDTAVAVLRKHQINFSPIAQNPSFDPNGRFQVESLRKPLDWYLEEGVVRDPVDLDRVINFGYVDRAVQRLGPFQ
jgi:NitT/TauT family transport system substrate-binding protein